MLVEHRREINFRKTSLVDSLANAEAMECGHWGACGVAQWGSLLFLFPCRCIQQIAGSEGLVSSRYELSIFVISGP